MVASWARLALRSRSASRIAIARRRASARRTARSRVSSLLPRRRMICSSQAWLTRPWATTRSRSSPPSSSARNWLIQRVCPVTSSLRVRSHAARRTGFLSSQHGGQAGAGARQDRSIARHIQHGRIDLESLPSTGTEPGSDPPRTALATRARSCARAARSPAMPADNTVPSSADSAQRPDMERVPNGNRCRLNLHRRLRLTAPRERRDIRPLRFGVLRHTPAATCRGRRVADHRRSRRRCGGCLRWQSSDGSSITPRSGRRCRVCAGRGGPR